METSSKQEMRQRERTEQSVVDLVSVSFHRNTEIMMNDNVAVQ